MKEGGAESKSFFVPCSEGGSFLYSLVVDIEGFAVVCHEEGDFEGESGVCLDHVFCVGDIPE